MVVIGVLFGGFLTRDPDMFAAAACYGVSILLLNEGRIWYVRTMA